MPRFLETLFGLALAAIGLLGFRRASAALPPAPAPAPSVGPGAAAGDRGPLRVEVTGGRAPRPGDVHPALIGKTRYAPDELRSWFESAGQRFGVPPEILAGIAHAESRFRSDARGQAGEVGMFQLMPSTASTLLARDGFPDTPLEGLDDPPLGAWLAAKLLRELRDNLGAPTGTSGLGEWEFAVQGYNLGQGKFKRGLRAPGYWQTVRDHAQGTDGAALFPTEDTWT